MHYFYVLANTQRGTLYFGVTQNLKKRLRSHNQGQNLYTKRYQTWKLIYYEAYRDKKDAYSREKSIKKYKSAYRTLKKNIANSIRTTLKVRGSGPSTARSAMRTKS